MRADIQAALQTWERENATTLEVLKTVPEGRNELTAIPNEGWKMGELIWHIAISERWFCADIMGARPAGHNPVPPDQLPATVADMSQALQQSHASLLAEVSAKDEAWMDECVDFYGTPWSRFDLMHLMFRHEAHHRGQLSVFVLLAGGQPPTIYGAPGVNLEDAG